MPFLLPTCPNLKKKKKFFFFFSNGYFPTRNLKLFLFTSGCQSPRVKTQTKSATHSKPSSSSPPLSQNLALSLSLSVSMEEPQAIIMQINGDEEEECCGSGGGGGDDFYEMIEAPKFVDLTKPDHYRPDHDDRFWFCLRVGLSLFLTLYSYSSQSFENFI